MFRSPVLSEQFEQWTVDQIKWLLNCDRGFGRVSTETLNEMRFREDERAFTTDSTDATPQRSPNSDSDISEWLALPVRRPGLEAES
jgi:hypothetical protein